MFMYALIQEAVATNTAEQSDLLILDTGTQVLARSRAAFYLAGETFILKKHVQETTSDVPVSCAGKLATRFLCKFLVCVSPSLR